jgi:hypothetical protein
LEDGSYAEQLKRTRRAPEYDITTTNHTGDESRDVVLTLLHEVA